MASGLAARGVLSGRLPMPDIIKGRAIAADDWIEVRLSEGQSTDVDLPLGKLIVPLAVWQSRREELLRREMRGVWLSDTDEPGDIAEDLQHFQVVAIDFPKFVNGRGYSTAVLLRSRYGYQGELRAIGDVLCDQMQYLERVGFDTFGVRPDRSIEKALAAMDDFVVCYQGSTKPAQPLFRRSNRIAIA